MALTNIQINKRPTTVEAAFGRLFYTGIDHERYQGDIFFTQLIQRKEDVARCYQSNDPTAKGFNEVLDSDGGVISIPEAGRIVDLKQMVGGLVVLATNGVWVITGTQNGIFTPTAYAVNKVTNEAIIDKKSAELVEGSVVFVSNSGIHEVSFSQERGGVVANNISAPTIDTYFRNIPNEQKQFIQTKYDRNAKKLYISFSDDPKDSSVILVLLLKSGAWMVHQVADQVNYNFLGLGYSPKSDPNKGMFFICSSTTKGVLAETVCFARYNDYSFKDFTTVPEAYLETPPITLDSPQLNKQANYVSTYMNLTESGIDSNGDLTNPSSCKMRAKWSWHGTDTGGKWSQPKQIYRLPKVQIPGSSETVYDTGATVVKGRHRLRGRGEALALRFEADGDNDMQLIGYTLAMRLNTNE